MGTQPSCWPPTRGRGRGVPHSLFGLVVVQVLVEILSELDIGEFVVKLNHRRLLDAMMDLCGVPPAKFRPICRYTLI